MHILIAPNAFKNSLDATAVALAIEKGLKQSTLICTTECFPIGDGGDGTGKLIVEKCGGKFLSSIVHDPLGRPINASVGFIDDEKTAIIEMANAAGMRLLKHSELSPLRVSSFGTGEQIKFALDKGARKIVIAMGGSATVDGGCGVLSALGIRFLDAKGKSLTPIPEMLKDLDALDLSGLDQRIAQCEVIVLCDVSNPLLGEEGAAAVFGPQKGASPVDVQKLETFLTQFCEVTLKHTGQNISAIQRGGTAGGAAAGLFAFLNARLVNGIDYFLQLTDFDSALQRSDVVITGEGALDEQTLQGKGPFGVAEKAKPLGIPVIGLAGKIQDQKNETMMKYFDQLIAISDVSADLATSLRDTADNLRKASLVLGDRLATK
jgi:glycerate kinase